MQGILERTHGRVVGVVELGVERHWRLEIRDTVPAHAGPEQAPDLGRQGILIARFFPQRVANAPFAEAIAVERRGIEEAAAAVPGRLEAGLGVLFGDHGEQIAQRRGPEADFGNADRGFSQIAQVHRPP